MPQSDLCERIEVLIMSIGACLSLYIHLDYSNTNKKCTFVFTFTFFNLEVMQKIIIDTERLRIRNLKATGLATPSSGGSAEAKI